MAEPDCPVAGETWLRFLVRKDSSFVSATGSKLRRWRLRRQAAAADLFTPGSLPSCPRPSSWGEQVRSSHTGTMRLGTGILSSAQEQGPVARLCPSLSGAALAQNPLDHVAITNPYDEALHTRNQTQHGSWVLALTAQKKPA